MAMQSLLWFGYLLARICGALAEECDQANEHAHLEARIEALEALARGSLHEDDSDRYSARSAGLAQTNSTAHADRFIVAREQKSWHTSSRFVVAVDGLPRVTAAYMQSETTFGGLPHHFLLGGINGMLHVHSLTGRLIFEYETEGASPITAIIEKRHRSNSTHVITGHANGCVRWHILEYSLSVKAPLASSMRQVGNNSYCPDAADNVSPDASIKLLSIGRMYQQHQKLAAVAVTEGNDVLMLRDGARAPVAASSEHDILHVYFENRQVRLLTEHGFSHTMLHSNNSTVKVMKCRDLNSTRLIAAAPDLSMNTRAYGISADGEFVSLALPGEKRILSCRMRFKRRDFKVDERGASMAMVHDGILLADAKQLLLFNSTGRLADSQGPVIQEELANLPRRIGILANSKLSTAPVMSSTDGYVVLQLTDSIMAVYHRPSPAVSNLVSVDWLKWSRPLMILGALVFGAFQFSKKRTSRYSSNADQSTAAEMRMRSRMLERARMACS